MSVRKQVGSVRCMRMQWLHVGCDTTLQLLCLLISRRGSSAAHGAGCARRRRRANALLVRRDVSNRNADSHCCLCLLSLWVIILN